MQEVRAWIVMDDGVRLNVSLFHPDAVRGPQPAIVEALPYRKDDCTASYRSEYARLVDEGGYHVCRIDVRGTGSSGGIAEDEYTEREHLDLEAVIEWLTHQPWCSGAVGMYGTSYSGFNALQLAARRPAALRAVVAIYATDDRYTDDVHYMGGALRQLDLVDYVHYMTAFNALPPVPAVHGAGWEQAWRARIEQTEPWMLRWLEEQFDSPYWRHGSLRAAASGDGAGLGYDRIDCATMIVAGWADGYRNNTLRTFEHLRCPKALLAGPWSHSSPMTVRPGPNIDLVPEMLRWWDRWLRGIENGVEREAPVRLFVRSYATPEPDLARHPGEWRSEPGWPSPRATRCALVAPSEVRSLAVEADVGSAAWNSCAGGLPWGQALDQRADEARSLLYRWPVEERLEIVGTARVQCRVRSDQPIAYLAAKLSEAPPDSASMLITRGLLNLSARDSLEHPTPLVPGRWYDVDVELETAAWITSPGHELRLAIAGTDWPNVLPPPVSPRLDVADVRLVLPLLEGRSLLAPPTFASVPEHEPAAADGDVGPAPEWRVERNVLARTTTATTAYGADYDTELGGHCRERYEGSVTSGGGSTARTFVEIVWPDATVVADARLVFAADATHYDVSIELDTSLDGAPFVARTWHRRIVRRLQ